jgi:hypothetical protein
LDLIAAVIFVSMKPGWITFERMPQSIDWLVRTIGRAQLPGTPVRVR